MTRTASLFPLIGLVSISQMIGTISASFEEAKPPPIATPLAPVTQPFSGLDSEPPEFASPLTPATFSMAFDDPPQRVPIDEEIRLKTAQLAALNLDVPVQQRPFAPQLPTVAQMNEIMMAQEIQRSILNPIPPAVALGNSKIHQTRGKQSRESRPRGNQPRLGYNLKGMPQVLSNSLVLMVAKTVPYRVYFKKSGNADLWAPVWRAWRRKHSPLPPLNEGGAKAPQFEEIRKEWMKVVEARELLIFNRIDLQLIRGDKIKVTGHLCNGWKHLFKHHGESALVPYNGWYPKPTPSSQNRAPFRLIDQWRMAHQFLLENGWSLNTELAEGTVGGDMFAVFER